MPATQRSVLEAATMLCRHRMSAAKMAVLLMLYKTEKMRMTDMASAICYTTAAMTEIIQSLVEGAAVERKHDTEDRRAIYVSLTDLGRSMVNEMFTAPKKA